MGIVDGKLKCHICNNMDNKGIILLDKYICRECETDLVGASVFEFKYEKIRREIKNIWENVNKNTIIEAYRCN